MNENRKRGTSNNKILTAIAIASLFIGSSKIMAIETYSENSFGVTEQMQAQTARGIVVDQNGEPIIGASILEKGTTNGVTTDLYGKFSLNVKRGATLVISYIGYKTQEAKADANMKITLTEDSELLDEVVVVGYGVQKKKLVTGATVQVKGEDIAKLNTVDALGALQSQSPGVNITQNNGFLGSGFKVNIRGIGTTGTFSPLYVVDGVANGSIDGLNPSDIESLDVLKDAASAAIYGARAANGVILITTKRGKTGVAEVSYDGYVGVQNLYKIPTILNAQEYMMMQDEGRVMDGLSPYNWATYIPERDLQAIQNGTWKGTNWLKEVLNEDALVQNHAVNITGGTDRSRYAIGISYTNQEATMGVPGEFPEMNRYNFRVNSDHVVMKKGNLDFLKVGETINYKYSQTQGSFGTGGIYWNGVHNMLIMSPLMHPYNSDGGYYLYADQEKDNYKWDISNGANKNPIAYLDYYMNQNLSKSHYMQSSFYAELQPIKNLRIKSQFGYIMGASSYRSYLPRFDYLSASLNNAEDKVTQSMSMYNRWSWDNTANYIFNIDDHNIDVLVGQSIEKWGMGEEMSGSAIGSNFYDFKHAYLSNVPLTANSVSSLTGKPNGEGSIASFFGRVNYNFREKYLLSFTMRADGSSKFAAGNRWGYFPAASAGWIVDEEAFWPRNKVVSSLKLRASYGLTGNNGIGLYDTYGSYNSAYQYNGMSTTTTGEMPNSNLTWESTTQVNAGLDMGLADDRVRVSFDYYDKVTRNLLFDVTLPNTTGYGSVVSNVGKVRFYGVDLAISSVNISRGDFTWTTDFTYNFNMNKVLKLPDNGNVRNRMDGITIGDGSQFGGIAEGERMGRIYGYKVDHIIETQADADAAMYDASSRGYRRSDRRQIAGRKDIGDYEWVNRAGSTQRDGRDIINEEDQFLLGYATPHSTGGIGNTFRYRNWSLNIYMDYALGHSIQNEMQMRYFMATMGNCNWNLVNDVKQCWSQPGDKTKYARFTANDPDWGNRNFSRMSDVFVEKGDYLCIRDISLSYKLPVRWTSRLGMKDVTLTVSGNTLYYWTAVHGVSPEAATTGGLYNSASTYATGFSPYPPARKILFSAKFTF